MGNECRYHPTLPASQMDCTFRIRIGKYRRTVRRKNEIKIFSSPEGNANAVGEHVVAMLLALTRKITAADLSVKQKEWLRELHRGVEIKNMTIAIIGLGHMGRSVAQK